MDEQNKVCFNVFFFFPEERKKREERAKINHKCICSFAQELLRKGGTEWSACTV